MGAGRSLGQGGGLHPNAYSVECCYAYRTLPGLPLPTSHHLTPLRLQSSEAELCSAALGLTRLRRLSLLVLPAWFTSKTPELEAALRHLPLVELDK